LKTIRNGTGRIGDLNDSRRKDQRSSGRFVENHYLRKREIFFFVLVAGEDLGTGTAE